MSKATARYALIGIHPKTREIVYLATCGEHLQSHWDDMDGDLIPAIVPTAQARAKAFEPVTADVLTRHILRSEGAA